ncbi:MAG: hypothetical protein K6G84_14015, partial [Lachnospiraceae bacterium]|nr:hypothetical protein [Lachnospiraceae bacterium]
MNMGISGRYKKILAILLCAALGLNTYSTSILAEEDEGNNEIVVEEGNEDEADSDKESEVTSEEKSEEESNQEKSEDSSEKQEKEETQVESEAPAEESAQPAESNQPAPVEPTESAPDESVPEESRETVVLLDNEMRIVKPVYDYLKFQRQRDKALNTLKASGSDLRTYWEF